MSKPPAEPWPAEFLHPTLDFFQGGKTYLYANFFCYAKFSLVLDQTFRKEVAQGQCPPPPRRRKTGPAGISGYL